jgi:hypothetical protein
LKRSQKAPASEGGRYENAAACDFETTIENNPYSFGIDAVLFMQNLLGKRCFGVCVIDWDNRLQDDGAGVKIFVD